MREDLWTMKDLKARACLRMLWLNETFPLGVGLFSLAGVYYQGIS